MTGWVSHASLPVWSMTRLARLASGLVCGSLRLSLGASMPDMGYKEGEQCYSEGEYSQLSASVSSPCYPL